jgi:para-aminobenzoate synthetase component I
VSANALEVVALEYCHDTAARVQNLAALPWFTLLDSCRFATSGGRYDIAVWDPVATLTTFGARTVITDASGSRESSGDPFDLIREHLGDDPQHDFLPFVGGAVGAFSYDLARNLEQLPTRALDDLELPDMAVGIYRQALVVDHEGSSAWFIHRGLSTDAVHGCVQQLAIPRTMTPATFASDFTVTSPVCPDISFTEYSNAFSRIKNYIRDGDCYQVNYAQRFSARAAGNAWDAYQRLRLRNAAPYAAFLRLPMGDVVCSSPERFLQVRSGRVETKPIKGTRSRSAEPRLDEALAAELTSSQKDRAENLMIVDLLRNDLGKSCTTGSVSVPKLFELESFARVHHLVSTVTADVPHDKHALDILRDCFPGGSITGAPKLRAMEIIEELEPTRRSIYCGAVGYISDDGQMDTNIAIRTLLFTGQQLHCWAGGGIVADSRLDEEYQESFNKAAALLSVFNDAEVPNLGR